MALKSIAASKKRKYVTEIKKNGFIKSYSKYHKVP